ncbi:MAG: hydroxyacid dehydrogenase [Bacteroidia bacterium]|nr:hydroxyacid dehydrogenase [Bacteroidia bacterium]
MRVLLADSNHSVLHETLMQAGFACDLFWSRSATELQAILPEYDVLVIRSKFKLTKEVIDSAKHLKCIGRVGAGLENIDVAYAQQKGIACINVPEGNRDAVGEHALGMLLMLLNHLKKADAEVRQGIWLRAENRGFELKDKTVGIIGFGHMGSSFAKKLSGMECHILAYDKYKNNYGNSYVEACRLEKIMQEADVLSLHVPLTSETRYMVNSDFIRTFKKNIYLLNTARGQCLNTADLVAAIESGKVLGAGLDVLEYESVSFEQINAAQLPEPMQYLIKSDKVILSPHIAGWTHESNYKMSKLVAERIIENFKS